MTPDDTPHNHAHYNAHYNAGLHRAALLTAVATFPLIFMGGLVTSHDAGLAVPDWPNSYGYNMFLFPPSLWVGNIFYEHTHRLMATVVGMLAMLLAAWAWRPQIINLAARLAHAALGRPAHANPIPPCCSRRERWLALAVLAGVIFQGVLGGLRVVLLKLDLAIVHACVAQAFFCLAAFTALATSRTWRHQQASETRSDVRGRRLVALACVTVALVYLQLIAGATMRHYRAGLAITDLPLAYGRLVPATDPQSLAQINRARVLDHLDAVSPAQIWLHFSHRAGAMLVSVTVVALVVLVFRRHWRERALRTPALLLAGLLGLQLTLGVLTVLLRKPADVASAHVAIGALLLVTSFILAAQSLRLYPRRRDAKAPRRTAASSLASVSAELMPA